ncbi:hypothetical protein [Posidoniimonas corsicana]|uniref:hypothetical protein n=1 Tax=Posidoniimonas corsicana TaxID=1938618 RepID=UPI0011B564E5|nr:hypothetical protein [Posidoniimonas corsicana]
MTGVTLLSVPLGWWAYSYAAYRHEERLIEKINSSDSYFLQPLPSGTVSWCGTGVSGTIKRAPGSGINRFLAKWLPDPFERVGSISLYGSSSMDDVLDHAVEFGRLRELIADDHCVSSAAIERFRQRRPDVQIQLRPTSAVDYSGPTEADDWDPFSGGGSPFD